MEQIYLILVLASMVTVFALIIGWTRRDGELPATVSDMAYGHKSKTRRLLYTLWLWTATFTLTPALFDMMPEEWEGLAHVYATSMVLAGLLPMVRKDRDLWFTVSGLAGGVFSQCCVCVICPWWMLVWTHLAALMVFSDNGDSIPYWIHRKGVFLAEFVSWFCLAAALLTKLITT